MSVVRFLLGTIALAAVVAPVALAATQWRRRLLPSLTGVIGVLTTLLLSLTTLVIVAQMLGAVGLFSALPLAFAYAIVGVGGWFAAQQRPTPSTVPSVEMPPHTLPRTSLLFAAATTTAAVGEWGTRTVEQLSTGFTSIDTIWYHMPIAARFAQSGETLPLHRLEDQALTTFFPANTALLHAVGIEFTRTDFFSVLSSMACLAVLLAAAWAVGRPFGVAPIAMGMTAAVMSLPAITSTQPGTAYNDTFGIAFLLIAVALLIHFDGARSADSLRRSPSVPTAVTVVGMALGMAIGTKFQFVLPAAALALGAVLTARWGTLLSRFAGLFVSTSVFGGYWYVRNAFAAENPLPAFAFSFGPIDLRAVEPAVPISSLVQHLDKPEYVDNIFLPGLGQALGSLWFILLGVLIFGIIVGLTRGGQISLLSAVAGITLVGFLFSPAAYAWIEGGPPANFTVILRYLATGLVLGAVAAALALHFSNRLLAALIGLISLTVLAVLVDDSDWPEPREAALDAPLWALKSVAGVVAAAAILAGLWWWLNRGGSQALGARLGIMSAVVLLLSLPAYAYYENNRYEQLPLLPAELAELTQSGNQRIGLVNVVMQYPFYGPQLNNYVQVIAQPGERGSTTAVTDCNAFIEIVNREKLDTIVLFPHGYPLVLGASTETAWITNDPAVEPYFTEAQQDNAAQAQAFTINGPLSTAGCDAEAVGGNS